MSRESRFMAHDPSCAFAVASRAPVRDYADTSPAKLGRNEEGSLLP